MGSLELVEATEVLEPNEPTLAELAAAANREHACVIGAITATLDHAILAGEALAAAKRACPDGTWMSWLTDNFAASHSTAQGYIRVATYQELIRDGLSKPTLKEALRYIQGLADPQPARPGPAQSFGDPRRKEAARLREAGATYDDIARLLGVSRPSVIEWLDPVQRKRKRERAQRRAIKVREGRRALERAERNREIKQAVGKAGAAEQKLYAMAERMQDVMGQAHREATDTAKRRHYALAGEHYRKMRDEIVRALGVS